MVSGRGNRMQVTKDILLGLIRRGEVDTTGEGTPLTLSRFILLFRPIL